MLNKLLKYDLKWCYKALIIFYILSFIFASLSRLFLSIENSVIFSITGKICIGITISMLISILINNILRVWARFIKNIYGDESYLTHTLPVSKNTIYLSKILATIITMISSFIVIIICLFICYYSKENIEAIKTLLEQAALSLNSSSLNIIISLVVVFFLEIIFILQIGYMGIILGHKQNNNKIAKSILFGILLYFMAQALTLLIIYIIGLFNSNIMNLFITSSTINVNIIKQIMVFGIILYLVYNLILYFSSKKLFTKGVNVD